MRSGSPSRSDVCLSLISTIWRMLLYPLPALNLTKAECELIMAPILRYCLPAMGYCRNFPRNVVFAPTTYMGLGIEHLYTVQEILRIKDFIFHTHYNTDTGSLYQISLEVLLLEVGVSNNLHDLPYSKLSCLATSSLIKSTWNFLSTHDLTLKYEIKIPPSRINDQPIMKLFIDTSTPIDDLLRINRCRLYLRAFYLSDITDGFGTQLSEDAWMGKRAASS